jgi:FtsH-binding integral membrane protein
MDTPLVWIAVVLFAAAAFLFIGNRDPATSPRIMAAAGIGLVSVGLMVVAAFLSGSPLAWVAVVVWIAATVYIVRVIRRGRLEQARADAEHLQDGPR